MATKRDVRLIVRFESTNSFGDPYLKLTTEVVYFDAEDDSEYPWVNCSGYSTPEELRGYNDLGIFAQGDKYNATLSVYGCEPQYRQPYRVTLAYARRMVATLTRVQRKLDKMRAEFGYAETVADHVIRFAKAVGCTGTQVFGYYDKSSPRQDSYGYVWDDAEVLKMRISQRQQDFAKKYGIKSRED